MDEADKVDMHLEILLQAQRSAIANKASKRELEPTGQCHFCEEPVTDVTYTGKDGQSVTTKRLFCDAECSKDWEKYHGR